MKYVDVIKEIPYPLLFATIVGSRGFDCATEQSDYDIHGVHLLPINHLLGFSPEKDETVQKKVEAEGNDPAIEMATHDLRKFVRLMIKGNGNVLEDLLAPSQIKTSPLHFQLMELAEGCFSKKCANHYLGMAKNQQHNLANNGVKKILHMYRCYLTGLHLMITQQLEIRLPVLAGWSEDKGILSIIKVKKEGGTLSEHDMQFHLVRLEKLMEKLEVARDMSDLPDKPSAPLEKELERFVVQTRFLLGKQDFLKNLDFL